MTTIRARRTGLLALLALVAVLPSCLTNHVWSNYEPQWSATFTTHVEQQLPTTRGNLLISPTHDAKVSLTWQREVGTRTARSMVSLTPADHSSDGLATVLTSPATSVTHAELRSQIHTSIDATRQWTSIDANYSIARGALGSVLSPEAARTVRWMPMNPIELSSLSNNSWAANLRSLMAYGVGLDKPWQLIAWQITDESLRPVNSESPSEALREATDGLVVVGKFRSMQGTRYGVMPARVAALLGSSTVVDADKGECMHTSRWLAEAPRREALGNSPSTLGPLSEHITHVHETTWRGAAVDGGFFKRVLATPLTLACDIALGPGVLPLWQALSGDMPKRLPEIGEPSIGR